MITSFEVGAVFKIVNEASPTITRILKQIRTLNEQLEKSRALMTTLTKVDVIPIGMKAAIDQAGVLAGAWGRVAENAALAQRAIGGAAGRRLPSATYAYGGTGAGALPRGRAPSWPGYRGGPHISGPRLPIAGGGHVSFGGGAAAAAGLVGYGAYEAAELDDTVWQLIYHSGQDQGDQATRTKFRKAIQEAMVTSGYNIRDVGEAALQEIRMFQGTPGNGIDVLPDMLEVASKEARAKGSSLAESMKSFIGLAHMTKQYDPESIKKLAPAFAYMSTANPSSLSSIEKAAGYAVPLLQSGLEIDPLDSLLLGTALTRAGATSTKSGTWLREMAIRAMPGTSLMSKRSFQMHEEGLRAFGLVDDQHHPTWFTGGKPDILKMLEIAGERAGNIPVEKRAAYERALFGAQGGGGFALLSDPAVLDQVRRLRTERDSPGFLNRYRSFLPDYANGSPVQNARTTWQEFNVTMADLGTHTLPAVNLVLKHFKSLLEGIRGALPGGTGSGATVGARAIEGAIAGGAVGSFIPGVGTAVGALGGGILGGLEGAIESNNAGAPAHPKKLPWDLGNSGGSYAYPGGTKPEKEKVVVTPPVNLTLNLDGHMLAQSISTVLQSYYTFGTGAASADGLGQPFDGAHNYSDK